MTNERKIIKLFLDGYCIRVISGMCCCSRNTVAKVVNALEEHPISYEYLVKMDTIELHIHLYSHNLIRMA